VKRETTVNYKGKAKNLPKYLYVYITVCIFKNTHNETKCMGLARHACIPYF